MTAAAAAGRFELQQCRKCGAVQYPPRDACARCLSVELDWTLQPGGGRMISETTLHHSHLASTELPLRIGLVQLQSGPIALAYIGKSVPAAPADVQVSVKLNDEGYAVLVAQ
ncbi:MAG: hypothetical protein JSR66_28605 [Proteobacteria bacterium]|nr:hypothetical protein [Pseudomonadota bacterium]